MKPILIVFEDGNRQADIIIYEDSTSAETIVKEIVEMDCKENMTYTISHDLNDFTEEEIINITNSAYEFFNLSKMSDIIDKIYKLLLKRIEDVDKRKDAVKDLYKLLIDYLTEE